MGKLKLRFSLLKTSKTLEMAKFRILAFAIFVIVLVPPLVQPLYNRFSYHFEGFPQEGIQSQVTLDEWEAALWMRKNLPNNVILVSDYFTMWFLTPLSNKVWAVVKSCDPPEQVPGLLPQLYYIKHDIFQANTSEEAFKAIINIKPFWPEEDYLNYIDKNMSEKYGWVIVISKRTLEWVRINGYYGFVWTWKQVDMESEMLKLFEDEHYFKLVYKNDFLYVYLVQTSNE
jgi:hypothetical protein